MTDRALLNDNGSAAVEASETGILMFLAGSSRESDSRLVWFDRSGKMLGTEGAPGPPSPTSLSPDGRTAIVLQRAQGSTTGDLYLRALDRDSGETRLTFTNSADRAGNVVWSPDGTRVIFSSRSNRAIDLFLKDVRSASQAPGVFLQNHNSKIASDWSADGVVVYTENDLKTGSDIWFLRVDSNGRPGTPERFLQTSFDESSGQISPDGKWMTYLSNETGAGEVYVRPFPVGPEKWKVSASGGKAQISQPRWNPAGNEVFYASGTAGKYTLMSVPIKTGSPAAPALWNSARLCCYLKRESTVTVPKAALTFTA